METEIAKSQTREQALANVIDPKPCMAPPGQLYSDPCLVDADQVNVNLDPQSVAVESRPQVVAPNSAMSEIHAHRVLSLPVPQVHSTLSPEASEWQQRLPAITTESPCSELNSSNESSPSKKSVQ